MNRPELGHKYSCVGCGARFYDLNRSPAVCPKCEVQQPPEKPRVVRAVGGGGFGRRMGGRQPPMIVHEEPEPAAASEDDEVETDDVDDADADEDVVEVENEVENLPDIGERAL